MEYDLFLQELYFIVFVSTFDVPNHLYFFYIFYWRVDLIVFPFFLLFVESEGFSYCDKSLQLCLKILI